MASLSACIEYVERRGEKLSIDMENGTKIEIDRSALNPNNRLGTNHENSFIPSSDDTPSTAEVKKKLRSAFASVLNGSCKKIMFRKGKKSEAGGSGEVSTQDMDGGYYDEWSNWQEQDFYDYADWMVQDTFDSGMNDFNSYAAQNKLKCDVVVSQCRDTCSTLENWTYGACTALGGAAAFLSMGIGAAAGLYCGGKTMVKALECKAACNYPPPSTCTP
jgi:hypothetical protein